MVDNIVENMLRDFMYNDYLDYTMLNVVDNPKQISISCENSIKEIIDETNRRVVYNFDSYLHDVCNKMYIDDFIYVMDVLNTEKFP